MRMILQRDEINHKHFEAMDTCRQALFCSMSECIDVKSIISLQVRLRRSHMSKEDGETILAVTHFILANRPTKVKRRRNRKERRFLSSPVSFLDDEREREEQFKVSWECRARCSPKDLFLGN